MIDPGSKRALLLKIGAGVGATAVSLAALAPSPALAKADVWRTEGASAFAKHHRERVVISDQGVVRLGRSLVPVGSLAAERVWDLARGSDGAIHAATGDAGKVFRRPAGKSSKWETAYDADDTQALSLAATPAGKVFVGTGPTGQVVELTDPKHPATRPDPKVLYIWDLASDADGNLYAATGPEGQLWKRDGGGKWSLVYDSKASHLLCVAVAPDGSVYAGSDGEGLVYRVDKRGKVSVLYDAPQSEVRALLAAPDGSVYAGTAAAAEGGSPTRAPGLLSLREAEAELNAPPDPVDDIEDGLEVARVSTAASRTHSIEDGQPANPGAKGSSSKPPAPGENAVYRIDANGGVRELFRAKALVFALARIEDRLLVGTGPYGQLYEVREDGSESVPLAKLDNGQILSMLAEPGGDLLLGAGDPGAVVRLTSNHAEKGELVSDVFDAKLPSRFGSLSWRGDAPEGTAITLQTRTGNVGTPDETWSDWSAEQSNSETARVESPQGRFIQYRVNMTTRDPKRSPELRGLSVSYRSLNLPPEITKLDLPDVSTTDAAARQTRINVRWDVSDPNDDDVNFLVQVRKEGWPDWINLTDSPITEKSYVWDASAFPSGRYRVKLVAEDRPSNSPDEALRRDRESAAFLVDREPPTVKIDVKDRKAVVTLADDLTRLAKAEYAINGGAWTPAFPDDGLFDSSNERVSLEFPDLKAGTHLLMVRATDAAGNLGAGDALIEIKD